MHTLHRHVAQACVQLHRRRPLCSLHQRRQLRPLHSLHQRRNRAFLITLSMLPKFEEPGWIYTSYHPSITSRRRIYDIEAAYRKSTYYQDRFMLKSGTPHLQRLAAQRQPPEPRRSQPWLGLRHTAKRQPTTHGPNASTSTHAPPTPL